MIKSNFILYIIGLILITSSPAFSNNDNFFCKGDILTVPIYLDYTSNVVGLDIEILFDKEILSFQSVKLENGVLGKDYIVNAGNLIENQITISIYANNDSYPAKGLIAFVLFKISKYENPFLLSFSKFNCNDENANGKFYFNKQLVDTISFINQEIGLQEVISSLQTLTGIATTTPLYCFDLLQDGKTGYNEILYGLRTIMNN